MDKLLSDRCVNEVTTYNPDGPLRVDFIQLVWEDDYDALPGDSGLPEGDPRLADYNKTWSFVGCFAVAIVSYPIGQGSRRLQEFRSGGLWSIEFDSTPEYRAEVEKEQRADLKDHLTHFGISLPDDVTVKPY